MYIAYKMKDQKISVAVHLILCVFGTNKLSSRTFTNMFILALWLQLRNIRVVTIFRSNITYPLNPSVFPAPEVTKSPLFTLLPASVFLSINSMASITPTLQHKPRMSTCSRCLYVHKRVWHGTIFGWHPNRLYYLVAQDGELCPTMGATRCGQREQNISAPPSPSRRESLRY